MKLKAPKKILIINIFGIGDVLFSTPLIVNLKKAYPEINIDYLCNQRSAVLIEENKDVQNTIIYERDEFVKVYKKSRWQYFKKIFNFINDIKKNQYDTVIDLSLNTFMSFVAWKAGIKQRIGYNYKNRSFLLNHKIPLKEYKDIHIVEYYLKLLEGFKLEEEQKSLEIHIKAEDKAWADEYIKKLALNTQKKLVGLVPGGGESWGKDAAYKRWSHENFAKLADKIIENFDAEIILFGGSSEIELSQKLIKLMEHSAHNVCGNTSLSQFSALIQKCDVMVLNDGGPLHISVASKVKTVSIFGPVDESVYGPYPLNGHQVVKKNLPCQPCYRKFRRAQCDHVSCLNDLTVNEVYDVVDKILN